jgi:hypothetical protein
MGPVHEFAAGPVGPRVQLADLRTDHDWQHSDRDAENVVQVPILGFGVARE